MMAFRTYVRDAVTVAESKSRNVLRQEDIIPSNHSQNALNGYHTGIEVDVRHELESSMLETRENPCGSVILT